MSSCEHGKEIKEAEERPIPMARFGIATGWVGPWRGAGGRGGGGRE